MGARVVGVDADGVDVAGADGTTSRIEAHTTIWAAGVQASPLAAKLAEASGADARPRRPHRGAARPHAARPSRGVRDRRHGHARTTCPAWPRSRCRAASTPPTRSCAGSSGKDAVPFKYRDMGSVATIGRFRAIASVRKVRLSGFPGWLVWFFVHLAFLTGFGDRFTTMLRWLRSMIGRGRAEREFSTAHTGGDLSLPRVGARDRRAGAVPQRARGDRR